MLLTIMRGLPGSGKSFKARTLADEAAHEGNSIAVCSTDNYFMVEGEYKFDPKRIGDAHAWNQARTRNAMQSKVSHIIVDNTNTQAWEAREYVRLAAEFGYTVEFVEADSPWCKDAEECAKRNTHGVPLAAIKAMLGRWEPTLTVTACLNAKAPWER